MNMGKFACACITSGVLSTSAGILHMQALFRAPVSLGTVFLYSTIITYIESQRVQVAPSDLTGSIENHGAVQPALWRDPHWI